MAHRWRGTKTAKQVAASAVKGVRLAMTLPLQVPASTLTTSVSNEVVHIPAHTIEAPVTNSHVTNSHVTNAPRVTNKARQAAFRAAHKAEYNAKAKERMAKVRAEKMAAKKA